MKNLKKVLALVVVFAMMLSTVAFAAVPSQVSEGIEDEDVKAAVERLVAFGMVAGKEDGLYHPEEDLTRAQFAKLVVEALGLGDAAKAASGTQFADVSAGHWASGYISVAAGQGIIKGKGDGNFAPEAGVTYPEAVTMLVRAVGYQDSFLQGIWPSNYVAKAADLKITSKVNYSASGVVNRGAAAVMVDNTLDAKIVKVETYEGSVTKYYESALTLLEDKLELDKYEDARIIANKILNDGLNEDEVTVLFTKDVEDGDGKTIFDEGDVKDFDVVNGNFSVSTVLGEEVTLYVNDDDEVIYAERENDDKALIDFVKDVKTGSDQAVSKIALAVLDDDYTFAEDAYVYVVNGDQYSNAWDDGNKDIDVDIADIAGHFGKFVVKNNKIVYAEIIDGSEATPWMLVNENEDGLLKGINTTDESYELDLTDDGNFDGVIALDMAGNPVEVDDIEEGNVLYVTKLDYEGDDYAYVRVVTDNVVEGEFGKYKDDKAYIDGKAYTVQNYKLGGGSSQYDKAFYSINDGEDVTEWHDTGWEDDMEDASGETVVAYTDGIGRIAYMTTEAKASSGYRYGIVDKVFNESEKIKMYTFTPDGEGDVVTYALEDSVYVNSPAELAAMPLNEYGQPSSSTYNATQALGVGDVIKFKLNADGEIAEDELYVATATWNLQSLKDFGSQSVPADSTSTFGTKNFSIEDDAVIIDGMNAGAGQDTDDFDIVKWSTLSGEDYNLGYEFYVFADDDSNIDVEALVFIGTFGADSETDEEAIYVIDKWYESGDNFVKYVAYDGSVEEAEVDSPSSFSDEQPYIATVTSDGKLKLYTGTKGDYEVKVDGTVYGKDGTVLTIEVAGVRAEYKVSSKTIVYNEDDKKSTSNIKVGDVLNFVVENDVNIRVIEIK